MTTLHTSDIAGQDHDDRLALPLSGWTARLRLDDGPPFRLMVTPGGGSPFTYTLLPQATRGQIVLGAHHARCPRSPARRTVTVAYGVLPRKPMRPTLLRHRPWRPAHTQQVSPLVLADRIWLAEQPGRYDEVRATVSGSTTTRLL